ncbi:MAG: hypothetical protein RIS29_1429, partial [Bacteroidota bacterium]
MQVGSSKNNKPQKKRSERFLLRLANYDVELIL